MFIKTVELKQVKLWNKKTILNQIEKSLGQY